MPLRSIVKAVGAPGSLPLLAVCVIAGLLLMYVWPRSKRLGRWWLIVAVGSYLVLALPWVANGIASRLPQVRSTDVAAVGRLDTLVVLDGDSPLERIEQAGRVYAKALPQRVWVEGSPWLMRSIVETGVPRKRIADHSEAATTRDQVERIKMLAARSDPGLTAVIASRIQMPRVAALAQSAGLSLALVSSPVDIEPPRSGIRRFLPSYGALCVSRDALYEHAALAYYRWRKWI